MKTRTGNFPIGFRRGKGQWQSELATLLEWAINHELEVIDLGDNADEVGQQVIDTGLQLGSINLPNTEGMISADAGKRKAALAQNAEYVRACAKLGRMNHFLVMLPEDPSRPRSENFGYMVESFGQLASVLEENNARIAIEGWPGPGALCCTPEGYRTFFAEISSSAMGINYDPSHLIRMRIDYMRFLREFVDRVYHVHGKDTMPLDENLYEFGSEQPPTFAKPTAYGAMHWRYTIPGHGTSKWIEIMRTLSDSGYDGCISIELEDANFYQDPALEQHGIVSGARFLSMC